MNVWRKDAHGRFTFANTGFCQATGRTLNDLLGKTDYDVFPQIAAEKYRGDASRIMASGEKMDLTEEHETADGKKMYVRVVKLPIRNAESQLRLLVNDPALLNSSCCEFIPTDRPFASPIDTTYADAITTALQHRPDISKAIRDLRKTTVELGVAKNDLLPQLDLLLNTYIAGLNGNSDIFNSYVNQFSGGRPGFTVGLQFEVPIGNRAAAARFLQPRGYSGCI